MNYKKLILITASSFTFISQLCTAVVPYYAIRPQGEYLSRNLAGLYPVFTETQPPLPFGTIAITADYSKSMNPQHITQKLFDSCGCPAITISGSRVADRGQKDWLADYFYLPNDFQSTLSFNPTIDTFLVDFNFFMDLSQWANGTYIDIHMPVAQTRFDIGMREHVLQRGVNPQPEGMIAPHELFRGELLENFSAYAQGELVQPIATTLDNTPFLTIMQQLKRAKISPCVKKDTGIADIHMTAGWNWKKPDYHAGFALKAIAPGGNRPAGIYLFEPMLGNSHNWEFGGCFNGHYDFWINQDETKKFGLYGYATITHVFTSQQFRTFDLINSPFSRYMLAQKMGKPITNNLLGDGVAPTAQYQGEVTPVANLTNIRVGVSAAAQADIVVTAHLEMHQFSFDIGYNFWARSTDNIEILGTNELDGNTTWALKGDAQLFGFARNGTETISSSDTNTVMVSETTNSDYLPLPENSAALFFNTTPQTTTPTGDIVSPTGAVQAFACSPDPASIVITAVKPNQPVPLSATQGGATIYHGTNLPAAGAPDQRVFDNARRNRGIDNPRLATAGGSKVPGTTEPPTPLLTTTNPGTQQPINTSVQPQFISLQSVDLASAKTRGMSSGLFAHAQYTGNTLRHGFTPAIGLGGQIEWAHNSPCKKQQSCKGVNTALDQWQLWLKLSFTFA